MRDKLIKQMELIKNAYAEKQAERDQLLAKLNETEKILSSMDGSFRTLIVLGEDLFDQYGNVMEKEKPAKKKEGNVVEISK